MNENFKKSELILHDRLFLSFYFQSFQYKISLFLISNCKALISTNILPILQLLFVVSCAILRHCKADSNRIIKKTTPKQTPIIIGTLAKLSPLISDFTLTMAIAIMTMKARKTKRGKKTSFLPDANVRSNEFFLTYDSIEMNWICSIKFIFTTFNYKQNRSTRL